MRQILNWKYGLGITVSAVFLYIAFHKINIDEIKVALISADYIFIFPALLLTFISFCFRTLRWRYLMQPIKTVKLPNLFAAIMIGYTINNLLPIRMGELARACFIGEKEGVSKSASFATIVVERLLDGITILSFLVFILLFWSFTFPPWLQKASYLTFCFYMMVLSFLILLKFQSRKMLRIVHIVMKPFPEKWTKPVIRILVSFIDGLQILNNTKNIVFSILFSFFVWLPAGLIIYCLLASFNIDLPISVSFLLLIILCIGLTIPSAPGFVGTFQFFCVAGLTVFSVPKDIALSFAIVYHASQFIPVTVVGLSYLFIEGKSLAEIKHSVELEKVNVE